MKSFQSARGWAAAVAAVLLMASATAHAAPANSKLETGCFSAMGKATGKHMAAVAKALAACETRVIEGAPGPCPDATAVEAINKSAAKALKSVSGKCKSTCSLSGVECIQTVFCPPNETSSENCSGKGTFQANNMGFPGPFCEAVIDRRVTDPAAMGECMSGLGSLIAVSLIENIVGDVDGMSMLSPDASDCLATILKGAPKAASKMGATVAACRATQLAADPPSVQPESCPTADLKTADKLASTRAKFLASVAGSCSDAAIAELDLCGGDATDVASAQACLGDVLDEAAYSIEEADSKDYVAISIINAAFPATTVARCGDNLANQLPSQFYPLGEECDGTDDSACPGECFPPGDTWECSCGTVNRARSFADGFNADLDNGWAGGSHNSAVTDRAGFISTMENCDCDEFGMTDSDRATCVGTSTDPVCDVFARQIPRCSFDTNSNTRCDQHGDNNGTSDDFDCQVCDEFSANAGEFCLGSARYCSGGANDGAYCNNNSECPGATCTASGRCDAINAACTTNADCGSGPCGPTGRCDSPTTGDGCTAGSDCSVCIGGPNNGAACLTTGNIGGSDCDATTAGNQPCNPTCGGLGGGSCPAVACNTKTCFGGSNDGGACADDDDCGGGACYGATDCQAQCYNDAGDATGPCFKQADCAEGEVCRGQCDTASNYCILSFNGAPLPLSAEGTSVCVNSRFDSNITGTRNIVTGEHAVNYELKSLTILAESLARPCPVCGGWCADGPKIGEICEGTCTGTALACRSGINIGDTCVTNADCPGSICHGLACRFDSDCGSGETCSAAQSPECPDGDDAGTDNDACTLELVCAGGTDSGSTCRIEAATAFGTTSEDCAPPIASLNISGNGLAISFTPLTSEAVVLESPAPCDATGYQNYDCNCVTGGGTTRNQPNRCVAACNAGPNLGHPCGGTFTRCSGGSENGVACDNDADCSGGGTCTSNPLACTGGANEGSSCTNNGDCGGGTCGDACPGGLCVPLCMERGVCTGGSNAGGPCGVDYQCPGGTCTPSPEPFDYEEGVCAAGGRYRCDGPGQEFRTCTRPQEGTQTNCEAGPNGVLGDDDDNFGAGTCIFDVSNCFVNNGAAEGGDIFNGDGDPTNTRSVTTFCIPASSSNSVNATAGLPGPGRLRQPSVIVPNYTVLP